MTKILSRHVRWPIAGSFRIAHGSVSTVDMVQVIISDGKYKGRGECRPYARYEETPDSIIAQIESVRTDLETFGSGSILQELLPAGAARNALDCAFWDLKAKQSGKPVWQLLDLPAPQPRVTAFTLSIDNPEAMARAATRAKQYPILKLKIDDLRGLDACFAVMNARPDVQLIVDANESLAPDELRQFRRALAEWPVLTIEQPLKSAQYDQIDNDPDALPILCADESAHTTEDLEKLWQCGYRAVNVKLDKCGGLTEAITMMRTAKNMGFVIMAGCMVGSSLAIAPMMMLESYADVIDLDGPLLLSKDIGYAIRYDGDVIHPPSQRLWG